MIDANMRIIFDQQHAASRAGTAPSAQTRRATLATLEHLIVDNADALAAAIATDFGGRARAESELMEMVPAVRAIRYARRHVARWMRPERRPVDLVFQPGRASVRYEPLGVVGIISPWNYPLLLALSPLADALAAGNRAMLKPSELTPAFADLLARLIEQHFDPLEVAVVTGGVETAKAFAALPFDHLLFTGSTTVGRHVMQAAAGNLTPVTLELGGKSPGIVAPDYPIDKAARSIAFGKFVNAGQTCIAPDYALVPEAAAETFARAIIANAERAYPRIDGNAQYSSIIDGRHRERLAAALEEAQAGGAKVFAHGVAGTDPKRMAPTVVLNAPATSMLMTEEIFGPILPIVTYRDLDEAIAYVTGRPRPLALYLFSRDKRTQERVLSRTMSGGVTLNGTLLHIAQDALPFGGIGPSGMGAYHGRDGFRRLSHARAIYKVGFFNTFERLGPPWGALSRTVARVLGGLG
ncbi:coniferyl aldehyde dehydrogenase [Acidocella sp.]|uniref:coniferyl aldehyde dehydrogenase n=1 Tax=Acidocella sp. TaxID=50710 RepID=UPI002F3ED207